MNAVHRDTWRRGHQLGTTGPVVADQQCLDADREGALLPQGDPDRQRTVLGCLHEARSDIGPVVGRLDHEVRVNSGHTDAASMVGRASPCDGYGGRPLAAGGADEVELSGVERVAIEGRDRQGQPIFGVSDAGDGVPQATSVDDQAISRTPSRVEADAVATMCGSGEPGDSAPRRADRTTTSDADAERLQVDIPLLAPDAWQEIEDRKGNTCLET